MQSTAKSKNEIILEDKFNPKFFPYLFNRSRFLVVYGGAGSGKSYFAAQKVIMEAFTRKVRILVIRKVATTIRESTWKQLQEIISSFGMSKYFTKNKTEKSFYCKVTGSEIIHAGLDDVEKLKSIHEITNIWIEEATELEMKDFLQLNIRLRGKLPPGGYHQIILSFNPIDPSHWLRKYFFTQPAEKTLRQTTISHSSFIDNIKMEDNERAEYAENLEALKDIDEQYHSIYAKGEWTEIKELIFTNFKVISAASYPAHFDEVIYGIDFGFNNPTAIIQVCIKDGRIYLHEILYKTRLTNADLIREMARLKIPKYAEIYADSAEPDRIQEISQAGYNVFKANKNVKDGIDFVQRHELFSNPFNINMNREFATYKWKKNRLEEVLDEPVKVNDHTADAARYAIYTHLKGRVVETDAKTIIRELNEQALKKYAEEYMELKYRIINQEGRSEADLKEEFTRTAALQDQQYQTIKRYVAEVYNY